MPPAGPPGPPAYPPPAFPPASFPPVYGRPGPQPSNTLAIVALVISFVPLCLTQIAAIVIGCVVLAKVKKNEASGRGMAIAAIVIGFVIIIAMMVVGILGSIEDSERQEARDTGSGEVLATSLRVGDCLVEPLRDEKIGTVTIGPCTEDHVSEVVGVFDIEVGPGDDVDSDGDADQEAIDRLADGGCEDRIQDYVGPEYDDLDLVLRYIRPLEGSITVDASVQCFADVPSEYATRSLRGVGR